MHEFSRSAGWLAVDSLSYPPPRETRPYPENPTFHHGTTSRQDPENPTRYCVGCQIWVSLITWEKHESHTTAPKTGG